MSSLLQVQRVGGEFLVLLLAAPATQQHPLPGGTHPSHDCPLAPQHHPQVRQKPAPYPEHCIQLEALLQDVSTIETKELVCVIKKH
jgi:hypothetical protein